MINPKRTQKIAFFFLFLATLLIVVPVGLIVLIIIQKGFPAINWQFLSDIPRQGMRSGGIFRQLREMPRGVSPPGPGKQTELVDTLQSPQPCYRWRRGMRVVPAENAASCSCAT